MFSLTHMNHSSTFSTSDLPTSPTIYQFFKNNKRREDRTTAITPTNTSSLASTTQQQQGLAEESYSAKTGIRTAALLGGMLVFVVLYVLWKARSRLCRSTRYPPSPSGNPHLSGSKFDLDYWLRQVDLLEANEAERNRDCLSPYLELPHEEPRDSQIATASWIGDAWRQWRLVQYRQEHPLLRARSSEQIEVNPIPYRRRRYILRRFLRRVLLPSHQNHSFLIEHSPSMIADMRPSIVNNHLIPPPEILDVQPRRVASWPRLKSNHPQNNTTMSALQTHNARKRLLKRSSRTTTSGI